MWTSQLGGVDDEYAVSVSVDPTGHIFVASVVVSQGGGFSATDGYVRKYDSGGSLLWVKVFTEKDSQALGIAADAFGNVYVTGMEYTPQSVGGDLILRKLDGNGNERWGVRVDNGDDDMGRAVDCAVKVGAVLEPATATRFPALPTVRSIRAGESLRRCLRRTA